MIQPSESVPFDCGIYERHQHEIRKRREGLDKRLNKRKLGGIYESMAARYLECRGLRILEQNYRCRSGEIDLIARDREYLVFVEVKYRSAETTGNPLEAVNTAKQHMISKTAAYYLLTKQHSFEIPCRFDVIGIEGEEITWVKNAFDYCG